jgi:hypothetical protein
MGVAHAANRSTVVLHHVAHESFVAERSGATSTASDRLAVAASACSPGDDDRTIPSCRLTAAIATRPRSSARPVWLYFRFSLSLRDVEELLAERGVTVTYETIRA